jgi:hypothetical protein
MEEKVIQSTINICDGIKEEIIEDEKQCFNLFRHCRKKLLKFINYIKSIFKN